MAKKSETKFKERIMPHLKALPNTWCVKVQQVGIRGTPDILMCVNGMFVALELKRSSSEEPDQLQTHNLNAINKAKGIGLTVYPENWIEVYGVLKTLSGEKNDRTNVG